MPRLLPHLRPLHLGRAAFGSSGGVALLLLLALSLVTSSGGSIAQTADTPSDGESTGASKTRVTELRELEMRWRVVPDLAALIANLPEDELAIWDAPYAKGEQFAARPPQEISRPWPGVGSSGIGASAVMATLGERLHADPLWNTRKLESGATDAAAWGRRETVVGIHDPMRPVTDSFAWRRLTHDRSPTVNQGGNVHWDVPHSPFSMLLHWAPMQRVDLMLRYQREYVDGAYRYFTDIVPAIAGGDAKPLARIEGLADAPTPCGRLLLLRRYVSGGDLSELVLLCAEVWKDVNEAHSGLATRLHGPFPVPFPIRPDDDGAPAIHSKPVWIDLDRIPDPDETGILNPPEFAIVRGRTSTPDVGLVDGTLLRVQLTMAGVTTVMETGAGTPASGGEPEGADTPPLSTVYAKPVEATAVPIESGRYPVSPLLDTLSLAPDEVMLNRRRLNAYDIAHRRAADLAAKQAWDQAVASGQDAGEEPKPTVPTRVRDDMGATLTVMRASLDKPGIRQLARWRFAADSSGARMRLQSHAKGAEATPWLPITAAWPNLAANGQPEHELLVAGRVFRWLANGEIAVPAALVEDLPPVVPGDVGCRVVGANHIGGGMVVMWWAGSGGAQGDGAGQRPRMTDVARDARLSHTAFRFTIFRDADLGLLWPKGNVSEVPQSQSVTAGAQIPDADWIATNVLAAKRIAAAEASKRLTNTVLIYNFDVKVESAQVKNKKGDVVEYYRHDADPHRAMLRMEDDFSGEWTVKAYRPKGILDDAATAFIADDETKAFSRSRGDTVDELASMLRARRLLLLSGATGRDGFSAVGRLTGFPVDPESGKKWNTVEFVRRLDDGSLAHCFFDADGPDHELVMARLSFPIARKDGGGTGQSTIELWLGDYGELKDLNNFGRKAEPLLVPRSVRGYTPRTSELRFVATFKPQINRTSYLDGATPVVSGFGWPRLGNHHFGREYRIDKDGE